MVFSNGGVKIFAGNSKIQLLWRKFNNILAWESICNLRGVNDCLLADVEHIKTTGICNIAPSVNTQFSDNGSARLAKLAIKGFSTNRPWTDALHASVCFKQMEFKHLTTTPAKPFLLNIWIIFIFTATVVTAVMALWAGQNWPKLACESVWALLTTASTHSYPAALPE